VFDGDGAPVPDCMLEIWQADAQGGFSDPQDHARCPIRVSKASAAAAPTPTAAMPRHHQARRGADPDGKPQAPHIFAVFAPAMLLQNYTRIYFDGRPATPADPVRTVRRPPRHPDR